MKDLVTLVDADDNVIGVEEKIRAHRAGLLHRAFSIFVFDRDGRLLIQRRARGKYHSAGLWSNTCCGHPRPDETPHVAATRRLPEEMGFACDLRFAFRMQYCARVDNSMVEHELDHVFVGRFNGVPAPAPSEVEQVEWVSMAGLQASLHTAPQDYTCWLKLLLESSHWPSVNQILDRGDDEGVPIRAEQ